MRKIMKRAFAAVIVAVMLLTSMPMNGFSDFNWEGLLGVKASAAKVEKSDLPEDFDLKVYMADVLFRTEGQGYCMTKIKKDDGSEVFCTAHQYDRFLSLINDFQSPATTVYNAFYEDKKFVNSAEAWEAIRKTANPSNAISDLNLQQQYESLIYAVLFDSLCDEKLQKASYSNAITNVTSFTDKLIDKPRTAVMFEKTSLDLDASDELKDTALAFLSNGRDDKWASILEYNGMVAKYSGIIDKILKSATDIYNYINKISMYRALADVGADAVRVLIDMKNATSDEILKSSLQSVIDSMSNDWFGIVDKVIFDVGFSVNMKAVKSLVDYGWKGCCEICPFLKGMAIGEAVGTAACNLLFATEDTIRQYEYMKMIVALENVSRPILKKYENAVKSNNNSSNAAAFWFTVDFISSLYATSANAANEMADICLNKGFVNYLIKICGGNNSERVEECKRTSSALLRNVTYNQKLIETVWENHIAEDYPQFFEKSNEEPIYLPSKTVKSLSVSQKTVYCMVGEYPSLPNITTDPADAECTYGFKSDNQDIFRDGTVFSVSQYYPAKIVGEANITVYSLEDSSVSDTFKLIVVSSDEEPDKPENTESGTCGNGVSFVLYKDTGTLYISGNGNIYDGKYSSSDGKYHANAAWDKSKEFIKRVIIAKGVTGIGDYAFSHCTGLTRITIPDSVTSIGGYAFSGCTSLASATIGNSVKSIGYRAFNGCTSLTNITIPDSVTSIGNDAFNGCISLTNVTIPDSVTNIGLFAFASCTGLTSIIISDCVTSIGYGTFWGCTSLTSITIPDSVTSIGDSAFSGCTGLTSITIPSSVTSIKMWAFDNCTGLNKVNITDILAWCNISFSNYSSNPLYYAHNLYLNDELVTDLIIPDGVTSIGGIVFSDCTGLKSVTIGNGVTSIGEKAFNNCTGLISAIIGNGVTSIGDYVFYGCSGLTNVTIPDGVTSIGSYAFSDCRGLTSITIPDSVTSIGSRAFRSCTSLTSITIPDSVKSISDRAFYNCTGLVSVTVGNSVTSIGSYAFIGCSDLRSITIPDSVTSIGYSAFYGCNSLADVYYSGSESEWNEIVIAIDNECLTNATIYYNYSGSHTHTLNHITVPSTCKVAGMEYDICSECGETFNEKTLPLAAHTWSEWTVVKEATTTAEGQEKRTCSVCDKVETRAIEKLKVIKDDKTGIEINYNNEYDSDTEIKVEEQFSGKSFQLINSAYGEVKTSIFDIATYKDGVKVQPNGEITVKIPLPAGYSNRVFVCYVDSVNGKVTKIPCEVKDGYVIFKTNHFSEYAIVEQSANVKSVSVSDIKLNYKKSTTITPSITADEGAKYTVKYSSSNTKVATVDDNGKVYAAKKGSATITCTVTDSKGNTVQDTCKVTVKYSFGQWLIKILLFGWIWY